ncbi:Uma2 family endonuclease [soil metagenome]
MNPNAIPKMTPEEFLAFERPSDEKHEYRDGLIVAMSGAKRNHNIIAFNIGGEIQRSLKSKNCEGYSSDMRVFVPASRLYTYPDLVVVCGEPVFQDEVLDTLLNPVLIVEILSESTESYDRGQKFQNYRSIASLREYVLISQTSANIEKYVKHGDGFWMLSEASGMDGSITLETIDCPLSLADVYDKVIFDAT